MWQNILKLLTKDQSTRRKIKYCGGISDDRVKKSVANSVKKYRNTYLSLEKYDTRTQPTAKNMARLKFVQKYLRQLSQTGQI